MASINKSIVRGGFAPGSLADSGAVDVERARRAKAVVSADAEWTFIRQNPDTGAMEKRRFRIPPNGPFEEWIDSAS